MLGDRQGYKNEEAYQNNLQVVLYEILKDASRMGKENRKATIYKFKKAIVDLKIQNQTFQPKESHVETPQAAVSEPSQS